MTTTFASNSMTGYERRVKQLFERAGIEINGSNDWDIQIYDNKFYIMFDQLMTLGFLRAELLGMISVKRIDMFYHKLFDINWQNTKPNLALLKDILLHKYLNPNMLRKGYIVEKQYNLPTQIFSNMLGKYGAYTCNYWRDRSSGEDLDGTNPNLLDQAAHAKYSLLADKLNIKPGMKVLDMGCGWGYAAKFLAEERNAEVVGLTIASEQVKFAQQLCEGLETDFRCQSYEDSLVDKKGKPIKFDAIWNLGMFEHVGSKNHNKFMKCMENFVTPEARFVMQTISFSRPVIITDVMIERCIFPDMTCSSPAQVAKAAESTNYWKMLDFHELTFKNGHSMYDPTLMGWHFFFNLNWEEKIKPFITSEVLKKFEHTVGLSNLTVENFRTIWNNYLLLCAGAYRSGKYPRLIQYVFGGPTQSLIPEIR